MERKVIRRQVRDLKGLIAIAHEKARELNAVMAHEETIDQSIQELFQTEVLNRLLDLRAPCREVFKRLKDTEPQATETEPQTTEEE